MVRCEEAGGWERISRFDFPYASTSGLQVVLRKKGVGEGNLKRKRGKGDGRGGVGSFRQASPFFTGWHESEH